MTPLTGVLCHEPICSCERLSPGLRAALVPGDLVVVVGPEASDLTGAEAEVESREGDDAAAEADDESFARMGGRARSQRRKRR